MQGYRLTKRGWIVLFSLALLLMLGTFMAISALVTKVDKIANEAGKTTIQKETPKAAGEQPSETYRENKKIVVYFEENSADIAKGNIPVLNMIVKAANGLEDYRYVITVAKVEPGERVTEERAALQRKIIGSRAKAISDFLVQNKIAAERIELKEVKNELKTADSGNLDKAKELRKVEVELRTKK